LYREYLQRCRAREAEILREQFLGKKASTEANKNHHESRVFSDTKSKKLMAAKVRYIFE